MNIKDREKQLLTELDWLIFLISIGAVVIFIILHFAVPHIQNFTTETITFVQALIINLIPVPLLFVVSYAAYRRIQTIRYERDKDLFTASLANILAEQLALREARAVLLDAPPTERAMSIEKAEELWLIGVALNKTVHNSFTLLRSKLQQGCKIKVLLMNPQGPSIGYVSKRKTDKIDPLAMRHYIKLTLSTLCGMKREFPQHLEIRVIDFPLSFGAVAADMETQNGVLFVEYYFYKTDKESLHLKLGVKDTLWYKYFGEQIRELWRSSEEWTCVD